jgi:hypothetical protein
MIIQHKIIEQLRAKWDRFAAFNNSSKDEAQEYREALKKLAEMSSESLLLELANEDTPGALPTAEFDSAPGLCLNFPERFNNHQEARDWASEKLLDHVTFAVDGSQIKQDPDVSVPVAAVQIGWFENRHTRDGGYTKDISIEILTPDELMVEFDGDRVYSEQRVNVRRFELEIETLCRLMHKAAAERDLSSKLSIALFDSSLVISFADRLQDKIRSRHVSAMLKLLRCSEQTGVPVVGYIDCSQARDLTNMLSTCCRDLKEASRVNDPQLLEDLLGWGARTPIFVCARGGADRKRKGVLEDFEEYRRGIGFVYLKTNSLSPSARLEIPLWVCKQGLLDEVVDLVRAEVIVGNGYPYVIESAGAAAVLTNRDREAFHVLFQKFAEQQGVKVRGSLKARSKVRRR